MRYGQFKLNEDEIKALRPVQPVAGPKITDAEVEDDLDNIENAAQNAKEEDPSLYKNIVANLKKSIAGDWDRFDNFVKLGGFVNSTSEYKNHPKIINGASDLLVKIFGNQGKHTRFAVGSNSLPMDIAVEIEAIIKIK